MIHLRSHTHSWQQCTQILICVLILVLFASAFVTFSDYTPMLAQGQDILRPPLIGDALVLSGQPDTNFGANDRLLVGVDEPRGFGAEHSLLQFEMATGAIPNDSEILSATLSLYMFGATTNDPPLTIQIGRVLGNWQESIVSWRGYSSLIITNTTAVQVSSQTQILQQWDVASHVRNWLSDPQRGSRFSIVLKTDLTSGQRIRSFGTKECTSSLCSGRPPRLEIFYRKSVATPTATATPPPTATSLPTPTPTSTPGIALLHLTNRPTGVIPPGGRITYTIYYTAVAQPAGSFILTDVVIRNRPPAGVQVLTDTLQSNADVTILEFNITPENPILWQLKKPLAPGQGGSVSYIVQRLNPATATPEPTGLVIRKSGPASANPNQPITYILTVTNHLDAPVSGLIITDVVPTGAQYRSTLGDDVVYARGVVSWQVDTELKPGKSISRHFAVDITQTITNSLYGVTTTQGIAALGTEAVVTLVGMATPPPVASPVIIFNQGATIQWQVINKDGSGGVGVLSSNATFNPSTDIYLPLIFR